MSKNNAKKNNNYYFPLFMGMGLVFGVILDQIAIGLCLGVAIGLALDNNIKKEDMFNMPSFFILILV